MRNAVVEGDSVEDQLEDLKSLLDQGLITQDDYDKKKQEILAGL
ncbi:MAG: SHOCT domain-containing protein [Thermoanaerobaculia bacterium]